MPRDRRREDGRGRGGARRTLSTGAVGTRAAAPGGAVGRPGLRAVLPAGTRGAVRARPAASPREVVPVHREHVGRGRGVRRERVGAAVEQQARPDRLDARAVGDPPGLGEGGDETQAPPVLRCPVGAFGTVVAYRAGGVMIGHLDDQRAGRAVGGVLQAAQQLDVGARVDDGVGDEFADHHGGVVGEPVVDDLRAGQGQFGPAHERVTEVAAGGSGGERSARQGRAGHGVLAARWCAGAPGAHAMDSRCVGMAPTVRLPEQFGRIHLSRCGQGDRLTAPISVESPKWAVMSENSGMHVLEDGQIRASELRPCSPR